MTTLPVAVIQAAPVPLDFQAGIDKALHLAREATENGAKVVAFGETFLGGYPLWLDEAPGAALWDHPGTRALHAIMLEQAVVANDERLLPLQELADASGAIISIGAHERVRRSLVNNQLTFRPGLPVLDHRKLVPTHGERLIWARGDGSTLGVHQAEWGRLGTLICWEHWMPLARQAMHDQAEQIHVAVWPTVHDAHQLASRHYAFEGRCFVLAAGQIQRAEDLPPELDRLPELEDDPSAFVQRGGSAIYSPRGDLLAGPVFEEETVLVADLDLDQIERETMNLDVTGHYYRPDVFDFDVNRRRR
jgi:predicted amidohydrolase